jgi:hypothetical protein
MSNVDLYIRMNGDSGPTEWLPQGKFYIDTRKKSGLATVLECYDKVLMMESSFVIEGETLTYPMAMSTALSTICTRLSLTFANPTAIQSGFNIEYPNDLTMREVLGYIADANGGNFILNDSGDLQLVIPANGTSVATASYVNLYDDNDEQTFDKVIMYYNDTDGFESGTGINEFVDNNIWATQAIADHVLSVLTGYTHKPYTGSKVYVDPAIELGDTLTLGGTDYVLFNSVITYGGNVVMDIGAPGETELNHEYPYVGSYAKAMKNKVTLGAAYYGTTIDRETGLQIIKSDNYARAIFNADMLALQTGDGTGNSWVNKVYFDPVSGKYIFNGTLSANVVEALGSVMAPYLYAGKANIAELTVDEMNTGDKVAKYLNSNTDDVNYIKIDDQYMEWITASTDGTSTEQVEDRDGNDLYWTDDTHEAVTTETTSYPVMIYVYTEAVKLAINFELGDDGVTYEPVIVLGAGDGVTEKSGKSFIRKTANGPVWEYFSQNDAKKRSVSLTDAGIGFSPKFFNIASISNTIVVAATAETVLDGLDIDFIDDTKIVYTVRMTIDPDAALDLTLKVRVDGTTVHTAPFTFDNGKDTITMNGTIEGITAGEEQTVDVTITPSTSTANIVEGEYQLSLIISDIVTEVDPIPVVMGKGYISAGGGTIQDCDEFDATANVWTGKANIPYPGRYRLAASTILSKGYIYGGRLSARLQDCDELDAEGDYWTSKTDMPYPARSGLAASTISDKGYIYGGYNSAYFSDCDEFDAIGNSWTGKTSMPYLIAWFAGSTILEKGYTYGGYNGSNRAYCYEFDLSGNSWARKTDMPSPTRSDLGATTVLDKGYVFGGTYYIKDCDEFDVAGDSWTGKMSMTIGRNRCPASTIASKGYLYGGTEAESECDEYDPAANAWTNKADIPAPNRSAMGASTI